ncbi:MAG: sensor domain-containing diguanylate cyclase [Bradymonadaceae bacterium]|nr:sensor domain-containing diguanylate cyclase [Lujinxingiaceae bacterium]
MTTATRSLIRHPLTIEASWPTGLALLSGVLYVAGFVGSAPLAPFGNLVVVAVLVGVCVWLGVRNFRSRGQAALGFELERALLAITTALVATRTLSLWGIDTYALVYLVVALVVSLHPARVSALAAGAALAIEWASHLVGTASGGVLAPGGASFGLEQVDLGLALSRSAFVLAFGLFSYFVHGREALERRQRYRQEVEQEREKMLVDAREFRLIHAGRSETTTANREQAEELIVRDAVDAVHHTIYVSLELLKTALRCHTCVLLWFDVRNEKLRIKELVSDSDAVIEEDIDPARGVIGPITRGRETVNLREVRAGFRGLSYYREPQKVTSFLGVPVIEGGHLRGVLCVDRIGGQPFGDDDEKVVRDAASYILRAIQNERMFSSIERTRFELGRFYEASRKLNGVLTPADAYKVAMESVGQIVAYDFAALTIYDEESDRHSVAVVDQSTHLGQDVSAWVGRNFENNQGLVSMVVKNRHYLPFGGNFRDGASVVFTREERLEEMKSMLVLPLIVQDRPLGTFVVAHREALQFSTERREMLEVVANQVAVTLQNARLYAKMEEMASIDGLTQLANRRTFQTKLGEAMARHKRSGRNFGLILTDIDHFKSVNDTYGHPVGDEVLREVGKLFRAALREVDVPARYGGEEFVVILEETELAAGRQVAERLREEFSKLVFQTDKGPLQCTISMGYACGPFDADDAHKLVDLADQALYHSKQNGRNRVTVYQEMQAKKQG